VFKAGNYAVIDILIAYHRNMLICCGKRKYLDILEIITHVEVNMRHNEFGSSGNSLAFERQ
jgi:hypothetical protein